MSLARAAYAYSDLILLDDPLSAVDTKVGEHIFRNLICGFLRDRTRILVTHNIPLAVPNADLVLYVNHGKVLQCKPDELMNALSDSEEYKNSSASGQFEGLLIESAMATKKAEREDTQNRIQWTQSNSMILNHEDTSARALIQSETKVKGSVGWDIYVHFGMSCGGVYIVFG